MTKTVTVPAVGLTVGAPVGTARSAPPPKAPVLLIMLENQQKSNVSGNTTDAPHINTLMGDYVELTSNWGHTHPSLANYLEIWFGSTFGITDDLGPSSHDLSADTSLGSQLTAAGYTWAGYFQSLVGDPATDEGSTDSDGNQLYAVHHNPIVYAGDSTVDHNRTYLDAASFAADLDNDLLDLVWLKPDMMHDMHDPVGTTGDDAAAVAAGDTFIDTLVTAVQATDWYTVRGGTIIVTCDEAYNTTGSEVSGGIGSPATTGGPIPGLLISQSLAGHGAWTGDISHAGILRSVETHFGLTLTEDATNTSYGDISTLLAPATVVTGTATVTIPDLAVTASGVRTTTGAAAVDAGGVAVSATGVRTTTGTADVTVPAVSVTASGSSTTPTWTYKQATSAESATGTTAQATWDATTTDGNLIVATVAIAGGTNPTLSVSDDAGNTYLSCGAPVDSTSLDYHLHMFYCADAAPATTIKATSTVGNQGVSITAQEINPGGTVALDQYGSHGNTSTSTSVSATTNGVLTATNELVVAAAATSGATQPVASSPLTDQVKNPSGIPGLTQALVVADSEGSTVTESFTSASAHLAAAIATFTVAGGAPSTVTGSGTVTAGPVTVTASGTTSAAGSQTRRVLLWANPAKTMSEANMATLVSQGFSGIVVSAAAHRFLAGFGGETYDTTGMATFVANAHTAGLKVYACFRLSNNWNAVTPMIDWFDAADENGNHWADWNSAVTAFCADSQAAGCDGIAIDSECYVGSTGTGAWGADNNHTSFWSTYGHTQAATAAEAATRGEAFMSAISSGWTNPDIYVYVANPRAQLPGMYWDHEQEFQGNTPTSSLLVANNFWSGVCTQGGFNSLTFLDSTFYTPGFTNALTRTSSPLSPYHADADGGWGNALKDDTGANTGSWGSGLPGQSYGPKVYVSPFIWLDGDGGSEFAWTTTMWDTAMKDGTAAGPVPVYAQNNTFAIFQFSAVETSGSLTFDYSTFAPVSGPAVPGVAPSAAVTLGALTVTAVGTRTVTGSGSVNIPAAAVTASGTRTTGGIGSVAVPAVDVTASGVRETTGTATVNVPAVTVTASGSNPASTVTGTAAVSLPALEVTASGAGSPPGTITGTATVNVGAVTVHAIQAARLVTVYTALPALKWDSGVAGVGTIYVSGTVIDNTLLAQVQTAAALAGITLKIGTPAAPTISAVPASSLVRVSTVAPVLKWASGVTGARTIYVSGTEVLPSLVAAVQAAATAEGILLTVGGSLWDETVWDEGTWA